jgi:hypothetical protein
MLRAGHKRVRLAASQRLAAVAFAAPPPRAPALPLPPVPVFHAPLQQGGYHSELPRVWRCLERTVAAAEPRVR